MKITLKTLLAISTLIIAVPTLMVAMEHDDTSSHVFLPWHPVKHRSFCFGSSLPTPEELDYLVIKIENGDIISYKQVQLLLKKIHFALSNNEEAALAQFTLFCNGSDFSDCLKWSLHTWGIDVQIENELIKKIVLYNRSDDFRIASPIAPAVFKKIVSTAVELKQNHRGYWRVKNILTEDELLDIFARQNQVATVFSASMVIGPHGGSFGNQEVLDVLGALNRVFNTNILALIALVNACNYSSKPIPNELIPVLLSCGINIENDGTISDQKTNVVTQHAVILRQKPNSISVEILQEKELYKEFARCHLLLPWVAGEDVPL